MYNMLEYSLSHSNTTGSLWFYSKDEATNFNANIGNNAAFVFSKCKLQEDTVAQPAPNNNNGILRDVTIIMLLKYISNFWRSLEMSFINCKANLKIKRTKQGV